jgi:hypothetical protein
MNNELKEVVIFVDDRGCYRGITREEAEIIKNREFEKDYFSNTNNPKLDESKMVLWNKVMNQPKSFFDRRPVPFEEAVKRLQYEYEKQKNDNFISYKKYKSKKKKKNNKHHTHFSKKYKK